MEKTIFDRLRLDGKVALVTGGARGIGLSIATALAEAGANLALVDIDIDEAAKQAARLAERTGQEVIALKADVRFEAEVNGMVEAIAAHFGRLDIAFNNAGICINEPAIEHSLSSWKRVMDINLTGVFLGSVAAARQMLKQGSGGSIINTASMSAHIVNYPQPQASYNASKAAVIQLSKSLAVEWAADNIRVNTISPGYIGTDLTLAAEHLKDLIPGWAANTPMRRLGRPDELQAMALYLASDASSFSTGSDYVIDGGFTAI